jgi:hypothetical protein
MREGFTMVPVKTEVGELIRAIAKEERLCIYEYVDKLARADVDARGQNPKQATGEAASGRRLRWGNLLGVVRDEAQRHGQAYEAGILFGIKFYASVLGRPAPKVEGLPDDLDAVAELPLVVREEIKRLARRIEKAEAQMPLTE